MVQGYFKEAEWLNNGYVPTLEEYLEVSLITCGYLYLTGASYVGMGEEATEKAFDWLKTNPKFVMDSSSVCRLVDDIHSNEVKSLFLSLEFHKPFYSKMTPYPSGKEGQFSPPAQGSNPGYATSSHVCRLLFPLVWTFCVCGLLSHLSGLSSCV